MSRNSCNQKKLHSTITGSFLNIFWDYLQKIKLYIYNFVHTKKWSTSALIVNKERYALQGKILHFNKVFTKQYLKHTQVMSYIYCIK